MKDFNIAKYLKENKLGPHAILSKYVDLKPLKEVSEEEMYGTVPYEGPDPKLDGFGDEFDQVDPVEEEVTVSSSGVEMEEAFSEEQDRFDRIMGLIDTKLEPQLGMVKAIVDKWRELGYDDEYIFNKLANHYMTKNSVQTLVDDGFEGQDIVDFFASFEITPGTKFFDNEEGLTRSGKGTVTSTYVVVGPGSQDGMWEAEPQNGGPTKEFSEDHILSHPIGTAS